MTTTFFIIYLLVTLFLFALTLIDAEQLLHHHHAQRVNFFHNYAIKPGDIVFLGDSITDGAIWSELFPNKSVKNRGINADTVSGVLDRLGDIINGQPLAIFLLIGTNNMPWYAYHSNTRILNDYESILKRIKAKSPATKVFVQSILPRNRFYSRRIYSLNAGLADLADRYQYPFVNLHHHFTNKDGSMRPEFSNDKLHLMAAGYAKWVEILQPYMNSLFDK